MVVIRVIQYRRACLLYIIPRFTQLVWLQIQWVKQRSSSPRNRQIEARLNFSYNWDSLQDQASLDGKQQQLYYVQGLARSILAIGERDPTPVLTDSSHGFTIYSQGNQSPCKPITTTQPTSMVTDPLNSFNESCSTFHFTLCIVQSLLQVWLLTGSITVPAALINNRSQDIAYLVLLFIRSHHLLHNQLLPNMQIHLIQFNESCMHTLHTCTTRLGRRIWPSGWLRDQINLFSL